MPSDSSARLERPQQAVLAHLEFEIAVRHRTTSIAAAGKGVGDRRRPARRRRRSPGWWRWRRRDRRRRCASTGVRVPTCGGAPARRCRCGNGRRSASRASARATAAARRVLGIGAMGQHAVERLQMRIGLPPLRRSASRRWTAGRAPLGEAVGALQRSGRSTGLGLDLRVAQERGAGTGIGNAEIDGIAVIVGGEAELQR